MTLRNSQLLRLALLTVIASLAVAALAQQKSIQLPGDNPASQLKPGAGANVTSLNCAICHSLDYIVRQPRMNAAQWDAEVRKMITVYGAPINDADTKTIADYLFANYGAQPAGPAAATAPAPAARPAAPARQANPPQTNPR